MNEILENDDYSNDYTSQDPKSGRGVGARSGMTVNSTNSYGQGIPSTSGEGKRATTSGLGAKTDTNNTKRYNEDIPIDINRRTPNNPEKT